MSKHAYREKLLRQVHQWEAGIDAVKARLTQAGVETQRHLEHQLEDLQAKTKAARQKLERIDQTDRAGTSGRRRVGGLRQAVQRLVSAFK